MGLTQRLENDIPAIRDQLMVFYDPDGFGSWQRVNAKINLFCLENVEEVWQV